MLHSPTSNPTLDILGIPVSRLGLREVIDFCMTRIQSKVGGYVCFTNVHSVMEAHDHPNVKQALRGSILAVADGVPLVWFSKLKAKPIHSRVCGPDFMDAFLRSHPEVGHAFIGGAPGQAEKLALTLAPGAACFSPPMRPFSPAAASEDWNTFLTGLGSRPKPNLVWVGLGAPKQELWMQTVGPLSPETLFMGVGAAFDFLTATKTRAPKWIQKSGLEWLYRLFQEPGRLWKRYLATNSRFIAFAIIDLIRTQR